MANRMLSVPVAEVLGDGTRQEFLREVLESLAVSRQVVETCRDRFDHPMATMPHDLNRSVSELQDLIPELPDVAIGIARSIVSELPRPTGEPDDLTADSIANDAFWPLLNSARPSMMRAEVTNGAIIISLRLLNRWWRVRLKGGAAHRYQIRRLRQAIHTHSLRDAKLWLIGTHRCLIGFECITRATRTDRGNGQMRIARSSNYGLKISSDMNSRSISVDGQRVRRWFAEKNRKCRQVRRALDVEQIERRTAKDELIRIVQKHNRRIRTYCHRTSRLIVDEAARRQVASVQWVRASGTRDDAFPWSMLESMTKYKCEDAGLSFQFASARPSCSAAAEPSVYFCNLADFESCDCESMEPVRELCQVIAVDPQGGHPFAWSADAVMIRHDSRENERAWDLAVAADRLQSDWRESQRTSTWVRAKGAVGSAGPPKLDAKVLDASNDASRAGHLRAQCSERAGPLAESPFAERGISVQDISNFGAALEVNERLCEG